MRPLRRVLALLSGQKSRPPSSHRRAGPRTPRLTGPPEPLWIKRPRDLRSVLRKRLKNLRTLSTHPLVGRITVSLSPSQNHQERLGPNRPPHPVCVPLLEPLPSQIAPSLLLPSGGPGPLVGTQKKGARSLFLPPNGYHIQPATQLPILIPQTPPQLRHSSLRSRCKRRRHRLTPWPRTPQLHPALHPPPGRRNSEDSRLLSPQGLAPI